MLINMLNVFNSLNKSKNQIVFLIVCVWSMYSTSQIDNAIVNWRLKNQIIISLSKQKCSLMFFQKNISENLKLDRRFKINKITCLILFNLQHFYFIFHSLFFYCNFHRSCALTICLSYHWIYLIIVFNFLEKSYTRWLIWKKQKRKQRRKQRRNERSENQFSVMFFWSVIEHSIR